MKNDKKLILLPILVATSLAAHKAHRLPKPEISTHWTEDTESYQLQATYMQEGPIFKSYDKQHFQAHLLPQGALSFRNNPSASVDTKILAQRAEEAIAELREGKKNLTHFKILKDREFNRRKFVGTIILKYKEYPFVLKLFVDNPKSFVNPGDKSFRHGCMAKMTGGMSRYLSGFARIKNLEYAKHLMATTPNLPITLDFPRKWFWLPKNVRWFDVTGKNFSGVKELHTQLPEVYAIIADEIVGQKNSLQIYKQQKNIYALCQKLDYHIDPNMLNFKIERATNKLVIIDTEYFRGVIGMEHEIVAPTHQMLRFQIAAHGVQSFLFA